VASTQLRGMGSAKHNRGGELSRGNLGEFAAPLDRRGSDVREAKVQGSAVRVEKAHRFADAVASSASENRRGHEAEGRGVKAVGGE
jgi:hypothetical protein